MKKFEWSVFVSEGLEKVELEARIKELLKVQDFASESSELDEVSRDNLIAYTRDRLAALRQTLSAYDKANG